MLPFCDFLNTENDKVRPNLFLFIIISTYISIGFEAGGGGGGGGGGSGQQ